MKLMTFIDEVQRMLQGEAENKGYSQDAGNIELTDFVHQCTGDGHAIGEIIYKAVRYTSRPDKKDLVKIAAWAFLIWKNNAEDTSNPTEVADLMTIAAKEPLNKTPVWVENRQASPFYGPRCHWEFQGQRCVLGARHPGPGRHTLVQGWVKDTAANKDHGRCPWWTLFRQCTRYLNHSGDHKL